MAQTAGNRRYRADLAAAAARLFTADLSPPLPFALLSLFYLALRIPYLDYGHGTDPDAWRVALTAHYLLENGDYFPSRLPGNPLHELLMTPLIAGGWVVTNLVTALASLLGVYLFARIVAQHRLPYPGLLTIGFAFAPLLYINSIATMDYMWTLTALLGAYYAALHRLPILTGVCPRSRDWLPAAELYLPRTHRVPSVAPDVGVGRASLRADDNRCRRPCVYTRAGRLRARFLQLLRRLRPL